MKAVAAVSKGAGRIKANLRGSAEVLGRCRDVPIENDIAPLFSQWDTLTPSSLALSLALALCPSLTLRGQVRLA